MTNEEIEKAADAVMNDHSWEWGFDGDIAALPALLSASMRALVSQAYEEAEQAVAAVEESKIRLRNKYPEDTTDYLVLNNQVQACWQARNKIRALKDSLVQEPVPST